MGGKRAYLIVATAGLGKAVVTESVCEGVDVIISSNNENNLQVAIESIRTSTGRTDAIDYTVCGLTEPDRIRNATREAIGTLDGFDSLVTSHSGPSAEPLFALSLDDCDGAYQGILRSTVQVCREALPSLPTETIDNEPWRRLRVGAIGEWSARERLSTRHLRSLKVLSKYFGEVDVRVNCVPPRGIMFDRVEQKLSYRAVQRGITEEKAREQRIEDLPVSDLGTPESFARTVAFLASPAADYVTGAVLPIDGGWHRHAFWNLCLARWRWTPRNYRKLPTRVQTGFVITLREVKSCS